MSQRAAVVTPARDWTRAALRSAPTIVVVGGFLITRIFLLFFHVHTRSDLRIYLEWLLQAARGRIPFADFPIEYPPLAWFVMRLPATTDRSAYFFRFRLMMGVADAASFGLLWWIVSTRRRDAVMLMAGAYVVTTVIEEFVLFDTLDTMVLALLLGALAAWLRASQSSRRGAWRAAAYALVGLGAAYKLIPIIVLPFLILGDLQTERKWSPVALRAGIAFLVLVAPFAISYRDSGLASLGFLRYHADRGVEIESTWATLMWLASAVRGGLHLVDRSGSWELEGPGASIFSAIATLGAILFLAGMGAWALALKERYDAGRAYLQALLVIAGLVLVLKMFSAQYLLWAMPLLLLAAIELLRDRRSLLIAVTSCVVMACLTTAFWPFGTRFGIMQEFPHPMVWVMLTLGLRNTLYATTFTWMIALALQRDRAQRPATGSR